MTPQELEAEALKLDGATRAKLAARLWESLDDPSEEEWNELGVQKPCAEMRRSTPIRLGGFLPGKSSSACVRSISEPQRHLTERLKPSTRKRSRVTGIAARLLRIAS
jgi:hypothetical protein